MKSHFSHIQVNVRPENMPFYRDLIVGFLGWETVIDAEMGEGMRVLVVRGEHGEIFTFGQANDATNDYDGPGVNHLAIGVNAQVDVDAAVAYLRERGIPALFETPRHRPEIIEGIGESENDTYYQVMFKTPDNLLFEIVYTGPQAA